MCGPGGRVFTRAEIRFHETYASRPCMQVLPGLRGCWYPRAGAWGEGTRARIGPWLPLAHGGQIRGHGVRKPQGVNPGPPGCVTLCQFLNPGSLSFPTCEQAQSQYLDPHGTVAGSGHEQYLFQAGYRMCWEQQLPLGACRLPRGYGDPILRSRVRAVNLSLSGL